MATVPSPATRAAVVASADRLHRSPAPAHRVTSPLGAWIVLAVGVRSAGWRPEPGVERRAELRFAHPYAVVATVDPSGPWSALPVFAAWVTEAAAPTEVVTGRTG